MTAPIAIAAAALLIAGCNRSPDLGATAIDCMEVAGQRYCFPRPQSEGFGRTTAQTTAVLRIPLATPTLRTCNAPNSRLDALSYDYDNVQVKVRTVTRLSSPDSIYSQRLRLRLGDAHPDWRTAGAIRCWHDRPMFGRAEISCLEREPASGAVHLMTCTPREKLGLPECHDESISPAVAVTIYCHVACFPHRSAMRRAVAAYLDAHRVPRTPA